MPGWAVAFRLTGLGWYVAVCLAGGTVGGKALDSWLGTSPVLTLVGLVLGVVVAFFGIYRMLAPILAASKSAGNAPDSRRKE